MNRWACPADRRGSAGGSRHRRARPFFVRCSGEQLSAGRVSPLGHVETNSHRARALSTVLYATPSVAQPPESVSGSSEEQAACRSDQACSVE